MLRARRGLNTTESNDSALHALRRLSTIASALGHQKDRYPDDVSTRGDVDACSRASRAYLNYTIGTKEVDSFKYNYGCQIRRLRVGCAQVVSKEYNRLV